MRKTLTIHVFRAKLPSSASDPTASFPLRIGSQGLASGYRERSRALIVCVLSFALLHRSRRGYTDNIDDNALMGIPERTHCEFQM